jgi:hypothetical protein
MMGDAMRLPAVAVSVVLAWTLPSALRAQDADGLPELYRLPFVIPGGELQKELPRDLAHWIPKAIAMRFGESHLLLDPQTCAVRGWWRSGEERLKRMNWGSRVVYIPEAADQAQDLEGARFEWGPRDAYGIPPEARYLGCRHPREGQIEFDWAAGGVRVTEVFRRVDAAWGGAAAAGVARMIRAASDAPPGGAAAVGGRFRVPGVGALLMRVDGAVVRREPSDVPIPVSKEVRLVVGAGGWPAVLVFRAGAGSASEVVVARPPGSSGIVDVRWRVTPAEAGAKLAEVEMAYYRLPEGVEVEQALGKE